MRVCLFGAMRVERGTVPVRLPARKSELLLAYLVLYPGAHAREKIHTRLNWENVARRFIDAYERVLKNE